MWYLRWCNTVIKALCQRDLPFLTLGIIFSLYDLESNTNFVFSPLVIAADTDNKIFLAEASLNKTTNVFYGSLTMLIHTTHFATQFEKQIKAHCTFSVGFTDSSYFKITWSGSKNNFWLWYLAVLQIYFFACCIFIHRSLFKLFHEYFLHYTFL